MTLRGFQTPPNLMSTQPQVFPRADAVPAEDRYVRKDNSKVKVQAWVLTEENATHLVWQTNGTIVDEIHPDSGARTPGLNIPSLGGFFRASEGDWVVRLGPGSFRKMSQAEFDRTYQLDA